MIEFFKNGCREWNMAMAVKRESSVRLYVWLGQSLNLVNIVVPIKARRLASSLSVSAHNIVEIVHSIWTTACNVNYVLFPSSCLLTCKTIGRWMIIMYQKTSPVPYKWTCPIPVSFQLLFRYWSGSYICDALHLILMFDSYTNLSVNAFQQQGLDLWRKWK